MGIHQISITYQLDEDRLLLRLRTTDRQLLELWLTRRLTIRLLPALQKASMELTLGHASRHSHVMPEARDMVTQSARERSRRQGDFKTAFDAEEAERPLGDHPLLVSAVDLTPNDAPSVEVRFRDARGRAVNTTLNETLLHNILTLMEQAIAQSEWPLHPAPPPAAAAPASPQAATRVLN